MVGQEAGDFFPCWFRKNSAWVGTQNVFIDSLSQFLQNFGLKNKHFSPSQKGGKADKYLSYTSMDFSKWRHEVVFFFYLITKFHRSNIYYIRNKQARKGQNRSNQSKANQANHNFRYHPFFVIFGRKSHFLCKPFRTVYSKSKSPGKHPEKGVMASSNMSRKNIKGVEKSTQNPILI